MHIIPICDLFLHNTKGEGSGTNLEFNTMNYASLNFTNRFLDKPNINCLSPILRQKLNIILGATFYLGVFFQLYAFSFPTRSQFKNVDLHNLFRKWAPESLVADLSLKDYNHGSQNIPTKCYEAYYDNEINPVLKELNIGWWGRIKCKSYFKNIFFAGCLLIMMLDLETKNIYPQ